MTIMFDQHGINHATVAICREMTPQGRGRHQDADTLFFGGPTPSDADQDDLAEFGLSKNYKLIFASFDPANPQAGPTGFHAVVTDGLTQSIVLNNGRLWKRDRITPAVLLFADFGTLLKLNAKSKLIARQINSSYHDHGHDLALQGVIARAARKPGTIPVMAPIGKLVTILDSRCLTHTFAAAA